MKNSLAFHRTRDGHTAVVRGEYDAAKDVWYLTCRLEGVIVEEREVTEAHTEAIDMLDVAHELALRGTK